VLYTPAWYSLTHIYIITDLWKFSTQKGFALNGIFVLAFDLDNDSVCTFQMTLLSLVIVSDIFNRKCWTFASFLVSYNWNNYSVIWCPTISAFGSAK